jgi:hypothetical protein
MAMQRTTYEKWGEAIVSEWSGTPINVFDRPTLHSKKK